MTSQQKAVLMLIKSSVLGGKYPLPADFDLEQIIQIGNKHGISSLLYYGALNCGVDNSNPLFNKMLQKNCHGVITSERQLYELKRLFAVFQENAIDYLPLKGVILKELYPSPEMRRMGDADILIREEQYPVIKRLVESLGYTFRYMTDHEIVWSNSSLCLELHKKLAPERSKEIYAYFGNGWSFARPCSETPYRYEFAKETNMLFLFAHLAKHYTGGGIGIQHMTDLWIYQRCNPDLDQNYILCELKKMMLDKFYENVLHTIGVWFEGKQPTDITDFITEYIFSSGVYGTYANHILALAARNSRHHGGKYQSHWEQLLRAVFPSISSLKTGYPILRNVPVLLPVVWIIRWFKLLLFKPHKFNKKLEDIQQTSAENVESYEAALHYVGLDFNFKE